MKSRRGSWTFGSRTPNIPFVESTHSTENARYSCLCLLTLMKIQMTRPVDLLPLMPWSSLNSSCRTLESTCWRLSGSKFIEAKKIWCKQDKHPPSSSFEASAITTRSVNIVTTSNKRQQDTKAQHIALPQIMSLSRLIVGFGLLLLAHAYVWENRPCIP